MTSKNSFLKLLKENMRQRSWVLALISIGMFLILPVYSLLTIERLQASLYADVEYFMFSRFVEIIGGTNAFLALSTVGMAFLCAITGFMYLHSREKLDFYHSLPVSRKQLFFTSYVAGLFIYVLPYLICSVITLCIGAANGLIKASEMGQIALNLLAMPIGFLLFYNVVILGVMLTGKIVVGFLASCVLMVYGSLSLAIWGDIAPHFLQTYFTSAVYESSTFATWSSPLQIYAKLISSLSPGSRLLGFFLGILLIVVFLTTLNLLLYKLRPTEAAEHSLAFPKMAGILKILIAIPCSIYVGMFFSALSGATTMEGSRRWLMIGCILGVVLLCGFIEFIYHQDLKQIFSSKWSSAISILGLLAILAVFQFDLFGYDTHLPKKEHIQSMSLYTETFSEYFYDMDYETVRKSLDSKEMNITEFSDLYALAQTGVKNEKEGIFTPHLSGNVRLSATPENPDHIPVTIRFQLDNGKLIYRTYTLTAEDTFLTVKKLCEEEQYKKSLFPVFELKEKDIQSIQIKDIYRRPMILDLDEKEQNSLLNTYKKEVLNSDLDNLQTQQPIAEFAFSVEANDIDPRYNTTISQFYIYDDYTETLKLLEQYEYTPKRTLNVADITSMTLSEPGEGTTVLPLDAIYDETTFTNEITDPDQIADLTKHLYYGIDGLLGNQMMGKQPVEICFVGENTTEVYFLD